MNTTTNIQPLTPWIPLYWEPVAGTGERLMIGVILKWNGEHIARRIIRDDVIDALYGKQSAGVYKLFDAAFETCLIVANGAGLEFLTAPVMGLHPGELRTTGGNTLPAVLRVVALMFSSLSNLDKFDDVEESDAPAQEEVNKRFATEIRETIEVQRPDLLQYFGRSAALLQDGQKVKFGFFSDRAVIHFSVLHPVRQSASVRDARARLWELSRAKHYSQVQHAALITAFPRTDDPTLGGKQLAALKANRLEIEQEADAVGMRCHAVTNVPEAVQRVLEVA